MKIYTSSDESKLTQSKPIQTRSGACPYLIFAGRRSLRASFLESSNRGPNSDTAAHSELRIRAGNPSTMLSAKRPLGGQVWGAYYCLSFWSLYSTLSTRASQEASMMFSDTPTVPQFESLSRDSIITRTRAAVPSRALTTRTL